MVKKQSRGFQFKHFFVAHDRCAMKVNMDSVLFGCWIPVSDQSGQQWLDVGTGTGLLLMMLAQRIGTDFLGTGVEIDEKAALQAQENIERVNHLAPKVTIHCADIMKYESESVFDNIVVNPPWFFDSMDSNGTARSKARHMETINVEHMIIAMVRLLCKKNGRLFVIIPVTSFDTFNHFCIQQGLVLQQRCNVIHQQGKAASRVMLRYQFDQLTQSEISEQDLIVRDRTGQYSKQFVTMTENFYLSAKEKAALKY